MIGSSIYSFGGAFEQDPKCLKQYLFIPDDQFKILNSLPEWSKEDTYTNVQRLIKGTELTILSSQASQVNSEVPLSKHKENVELFNKYLESKQKFQNCKTLSIKHHKSFCDFEDFKSNKCRSSLIRTNSTSCIREQSENLSFEKTPDFAKSLLSTRLEASKELFSDTFKKTLPSIDSYPSKGHSQSCNKQQNSGTMEVVKRLPVNDAFGQKDLSGQVTVLEAQFGNCVSQISVTKVCDSGKQSNSSEADSLVSIDKDSEIVSTTVQQKFQACGGSEVSEMKSICTTGNLGQETTIASIDTNAIYKNAVNSSVLSSNIPIQHDGILNMEVEKNDGNSSNKALANYFVKTKNIQTSLEGNVSAGERHTESVIHAFNNNNNNGNTNVVEQSLTLIGKAHSLNQSATDNSVTSKRKSESKRSSKRQKSTEKKGNLKSVKKAADISFSKEEIESMFTILKNFL